MIGVGIFVYVGDILVLYFKEVYDECKWNFNVIVIIDIVVNLEIYLKKDVVIVFVFFVCSGNLFESVVIVELVKVLVDEFY